MGDQGAVYVAVPKNTAITLYSKGTASVAPTFTLSLFNREKNDAGSQSSSKGILSGVFGSQAPVKSNPKQKQRKSTSPLQSTLVIPEVPNNMDESTIQWQIGNGSNRNNVTSWELFNPTQVSKSLELCIGRYVEIFSMETSPNRNSSNEPVRIAAGVLQSMNGNLVEIREQVSPPTMQTQYSELSRQLFDGVDNSTPQTLAAFRLPNDFAFKTFDSGPWGLISPYIVASVKGNVAGEEDVITSLVGEELSLFYQTSGLSYEVSYSIIVDNALGQLDLFENATITNNTNGKFVDSYITIVEDVLRVQQDRDTYEKTRYGNSSGTGYPSQTQQKWSQKVNPSLSMKRTLFQTAESARDDQDTDNLASLSDVSSDAKSTQKFFQIRTQTTLEANSKKSMTLTQAKLSGKLQYIHIPSQGNFVFMSVFFMNSSDPNAKVGMPLPTGKAIVYLKNSAGSQVMLGETWIVPQYYQPNVRLNLGPASSISAKYAVPTRGGESSKASRFEIHKLEYSNLSDVDVEILVRFTFAQATWQVQGDINFIPWGPENEGEPYSLTIGKGVVAVPKNTTKTFNFTVTYNT